MKPWTLPLTALVAALAGAGIAVGVMAMWEPWGDDLPPGAVGDATPMPSEQYARRLTAAEAGSLFEGRMGIRNALLEGDFSSKVAEGALNSLGLTVLYEVEGCETVDYNEFKQAWVIECTQIWVELQPRPGELPNVSRGEFDRDDRTFLLYDETEQMTDIDGNEVPYGWDLR